MAENTKKNYYGYTEAKKKANEKYNVKCYTNVVTVVANKI